MGINVARRATVLGLASTLAAPMVARGQRASNPRVLRFVPQAALTILDPITTIASVAVNHGFNVWDTLYGIDAQMRPQPQMAEGHSVSDDGLRWTIRLREGLVFHDGQPVRSRDCAASLHRWGQRDIFGGTLNAAVREYETPDDRTLVIALSRPFPLVLDAIGKAGSSPAFIMPERIASTSALRPLTEVIGSGPYRFLPDEFNPGARAAYARFDGYRPRSEAPSWISGGKVAHFERVEWHALPDPATAAAALQAGEVDWWEHAAADLVPSLRRNRNIQIANADSAGQLGILRFNTLHPPFDKPAVRRAVLAAVNQADFMAAVTGNDPTGFNICHSFFPCNTPYGRPLEPSPMAGPSIERARELLRTSGYAGEKVVLINPTDYPTIAPFGIIAADLLTRIGFNVDLIATDWGTVLQRMVMRTRPEEGGWNVFPMWFAGIGIVSPVQNALIRGMGTRGYPGWFESAEMEALNTLWLNAADEDARAAIVTQMQTLAFQEVPTVILGHFFIRTAYRSSLSGLLDGPRPVTWNVRRV